jgi:hypothetical protein
MDVEDNATTNVSEDLNYLAEGETAVPEKPVAEKKVAPVKETEEKVEDEEEIPGEIEDEEVEEEEDEEKAEEAEEIKDLAPHERPTFKDLTKAYPDIFKKFPTLRDMYFREQAYSQVFPSLDDAKEAASNNEVLTTMRDSLFSGDIGKVLTAVKDSDPKAMDSIAGNIMKQIYDISPDLHWKAATPLLENVIRSFYKDGKKNGNENMMNAAEHLSNYLFGDDTGAVAKGEKTFVKTVEKNTEVEDERKKFNQEKDTSFRIGIVDEIGKGLKSLVLSTDKNGNLRLDPDGVFSKFIKDTITDKVMNEVDRLMTDDKTHMAYMNSLWEKARKAGHTGDWNARLKDAYLARAKSLVPQVRAKFVSEALGTTSEVNKRRAEKSEKNGSRKESSGGRASGGSNGLAHSSKDIDWSSTSDLDFLNDNVKLKGK